MKLSVAVSPRESAWPMRPACGVMNNCAQAIRVLHVEAGLRFGGSHKALATYLKASTASDLSHHVLLCHRVPEFEAELRGTCPVTTLEGAASIAQREPSGKIAILKLWSERAFRLWRFLSSGRFDLVHINNTFTFQPYTALACLLRGMPAIAHLRNPAADSRMARLIAKTSAMIVPVSPSLGQPLQSWHTHSLRVCYDGVRLGQVDQGIARQLRKKLLGDGRLLIGSVGRLEMQKGYDVFVEAAHQVLAARPDVRFAILGEGPQGLAIEERIAKLGLKDKFQVCGFRPDVANFLEAIDVFVCPSRWEGGPLTVAEALLMCKPVVSTPVGFVPELTCDGRYAHLAPIEDVGGLAAAIQRAIDGLSAPSNFAAEARARTLELTDPLLAAQRFDELLRSASRHHRAAPDEALVPTG
jgi:glycosyltransferase involved in cell wall biosynthesis